MSESGALFWPREGDSACYTEASCSFRGEAYVAVGRGSGGDEADGYLESGLIICKHKGCRSSH